MWVVNLFCDTCQQAVVEGKSPYSRQVIQNAKHAARAAGWVKDEKKVNADGKCSAWICMECQENAKNGAWMPKKGDKAIYTGSIKTPDGVDLLGMQVKIVEDAQPKLRTVRVIFEDPKTGRYYLHPHWFYLNELTPPEELPG